MSDLMPVFRDNDPEFIMVFEIPQDVPSAFCFNGGHYVNFKLVDWFRGPPGLKKSLKDPSFLEFLQMKRYTRSGWRYLLLQANGESYVMEKK